MQLRHAPRYAMSLNTQKKARHEQRRNTLCSQRGRKTDPTNGEKTVIEVGGE